MDLAELAEYRFWLKNPSTSAVGHGFVCEISETAVQLDLVDDMNVSAGETWICSVTHPQGKVQFLVKVESIEDQRISGAIASQLNVKEPTEDARKRVDLTETLLYQGESILIQVKDVSPGGLSVLVPINLPKGAEVECVINGEDGEVRLPGKIVYSIEHPGSIYYRAGVFLSKLDRINSARWKVYLSCGERVIAQRRTG